VPSDPRSAPEPPDTDSDARQRAHDALSSAIVARPRPGSASRLPAELRVNLSLFTDALRAAGVLIEVGRGERPAHYGRPAAAERHRHGATSPYLSFAGDTAPFASGTRVRKSLAGATDIPEGLEGEVRQVFKQGGVWLADVQWDNGGTSTGIDCGCLELAGGVPAMARAVDELAAAAEADAEAANQRFARQLFTDSPPSMSGRVARGEKRPAWWGEPPAPGTRRKLIGDVLRVEDVLSESEIREFADAIELALIEVEGAGRDSDRYRGRARLVGPLEGNFLRTLLRACLAMPDKLDDDEAATARRLLTTLEQTSPPWEVELEDVAAAAKAVGTAALSAQDLLTAAQRLPEGDYKLLESALRWDVEDLETARRLDVEGVAEDRGDGLSETTGQRIARALETLTTTAGGALRELLDRTATDREAR